MHTESSSSENIEARDTVPEQTSPIVPGAENSTATPAPVAESSGDRRSAARRKRAIRVQLQFTEEGGEPFHGWVVDRSMGGMGLEVDRIIDVGTVLKVRRDQAGESVPWVEIRVQSMREDENCCHLGCQYVRSFSFETLMQFG